MQINIVHSLLCLQIGKLDLCEPWQSCLFVLVLARVQAAGGGALLVVAVLLVRRVVVVMMAAARAGAVLLVRVVLVVVLASAGASLADDALDLSARHKA